MEFERVYYNSRLSQNILNELEPILRDCENVCVNSVREITIGAADSAEKMNKGKKIIYLSTSKKQLKEAPGCKAGYCPGFQKIVIASNGCPFSCEYCFLQGTYRTLRPYITVNCNVDDLIKEIEADLEKAQDPVIYNAGEMLDSLALDQFTRITQKLVPFFAAKENAYLLLLTKSNNIDGLRNVNHNGRTIVSWSINCEEIINRYEHGTARLEERVSAAVKCADWGYPIRFRFDPLILHEGWQENYKKMVEFVLSRIVPQRITVGSLRFAPSVKSFALRRFPESEIFNHDFTKPLENGKCRYSIEERIALYSLVIDEIRKHSISVEIGLCKESKEVWDMLNLKGRGRICNCLP
ncbi:MAG: hypothetical protein QHH75_14800 [Bacillota bacterium]|nr:hypothetical protein [Bacillota bacterium]